MKRSDHRALCRIRFLIEMALICFLGSAIAPKSWCQDIKEQPRITQEKPRELPLKEPVVPQPQPEIDPEDELRRADEAYSREDYWLAISIYNKYENEIAGDGTRLYYVGRIYRLAIGYIDYNKSLDYLIRAEQHGAGDPTEFIIGRSYFKGEGTARDIEKARIYFEKAVDEWQNKDAMYYLGLLHEGLSPPDIATAMAWYKKATGLGHAEARNKYETLEKNQAMDDLTIADGEFYSGNYSIAEQVYRHYHLYLNMHQMFRLAYIYSYVEAKKDYTRALYWYNQSAQLGNADAMCYAGELFYYGWGVKQDYDTALSFYRKAAELGQAYAMFNLGYLHYYGLGTAVSYTEAFRWFRESAENGNANAMRRLYGMYWVGLGVKKDRKKAREWWDAYEINK
jgi:hypothetical protein